MTSIVSTAPTGAELAARYRADGLWGRPQHLGAIESWAERSPDRVAVVDSYGSFTYGQLELSIRRMAAWLEARDVQPGDAVVGVVPNWFESLALYHAVHRAGAVAVPLSMHARAAEVAHVIGATGGRVLVVPPSHADIAAALVAEGHITHVGRLTSVSEPDSLTPLRGTPSSSRSVARPDAVALVLFTSGSTAEPKGAIHTHETLAVANRNLAWSEGLDGDDVFYGVGPIAHIGGLMHGLHMPFELGARVVLEDRWEPSRAVARIAAEGVTVLGGAPVFPQGLVDAHDGRTRSPLRVIGTGGAWIPDRLGDEVRQVLGARLVRSYGSTECPFASGSRLTDGPEACDADDGELMPGVEARIVGNDGPDAEGELELRAASMFQGYLDEEQNAGALRDGWFATGDVVALRARRIKVVGRLKAIAIRNGENISLDEVERALEDWAAAVEVAAFVVPDDQTGERIAVAVVPRDEAVPTYGAMVAHLSTRAMARQKYPEQVVPFPLLPRTPSGKVDRRALAAQVGDRPSTFSPRLATRPEAVTRCGAPRG